MVVLLVVVLVVVKPVNEVLIVMKPIDGVLIRVKPVRVVLVRVKPVRVVLIVEIAGGLVSGDIVGVVRICLIRVVMSGRLVVLCAVKVISAMPGFCRVHIPRRLNKRRFVVGRWSGRVGRNRR